ncbi:MAG: choice-of-anchor Q domain-containing protein [Deltaproteobacteria bacterium]|nr:choice-of-anchor Q domain-containing protein [Deltaproteobacteria bacterium]
MGHVQRGIVVALVCVTWATMASAATFNADDLGDGDDAIPGDGVCASVERGTCNLRAAIREANALPGADVILLAAGTHLMTNGERITDPVSLIGAGAGVSVVDGGNGNSGPVLLIFDGASQVELQDLTLTRADGWGALWVYSGSVRLVGCAIVGNRASFDGAIHLNEGTQVELIGSTVSGTDGNGIQTAGALYVYGSTIRDNSAGNVGGGLYITETGSARVVQSTFVGNRATNVGGGIANSGRLELYDSTLSGNGAGNTGGGLHNDGTANLIGVTFTRNTAGNVGGGFSQGSEGGSLTIERTVAANNAHYGFFVTVPDPNGRAADCEGAVTLRGWNMIRNLDLCEPNGDLGQLFSGLAIDPMLAPLADNGGPTHTHLPRPGSPLIDRGGDCVGADQRGVPRPQGAACELGAVEVLACDFDGVVDAGERCDDGNHASGDGCSAFCETELLAGDGLVLSGGGAGGGGARSAGDAHAKLTLRSKDPQLSLGRGNFSPDDPVLYGATLRVSSASAGFDVTYVLPAANWTYLGRPGRNLGYRYKDGALAAGPIKTAQVQRGKGAKASGKGAGLGHTLGVDPNPVTVQLSLGGSQVTMQFGGRTSFRVGQLYNARNAAAPSAAP